MENNFIKISRLISGNYRYGSAYLQRALKKLKLGSSQHAYLLVIRDKPGISQEGLASHFMVDKANVTRVVSNLIKNGFIKREKHDLDKRCMHLTLSKKGESAIPVIEDILSGWAKQCLKGIKEKDLKTALNVLDIMFSNSSKLI
ncbi:MAG: hypothetical protein CVV21_05770 [Candidatus Goldiibacteriota bacterium HGW-Goldbacteria-1]|jgi:DNA-binding MarR family transcriptional regulator|nr:MAG: hypothetical protein CVV21_05770 [Candidatus Goldiibacteriota bacterium HGW-Goldbacteria-1]